MIKLYTSPTPNGYKISIALLEMNLPFEVYPIDIFAGEQKEPYFIAMNPNGRIPVIVDTDQEDFAVFESGAILIYLANKTGLFLSKDTKQRSITLQWLMFQMSGIGPTLGQAAVFNHFFPEKIPAVISRFQNEGRRLCEVLNQQLNRYDYIAGNDYTIADMATWPWVYGHDFGGVDINGLPALQAWLETVGKRPGVEKGITLPPSPDGSIEERIRKIRNIVDK